MNKWTGTHIARNIWVVPVPTRYMQEFGALAFCARELQPENEAAARRFTKHSLLCPLDDDWRNGISMQEVISVHATARRLCDLSKRYPVAATCHMGINRSALVAATALHLKLDISGGAALALMRQRRPGTISNTAFESFLLDLQKPSEARPEKRVIRAR